MVVQSILGLGDDRFMLAKAFQADLESSGGESVDSFDSEDSEAN